MSPEQLLGELEEDRGVVIGDLEAGVGTLSRLRPGVLDGLILVVEPTTKSMEAGRRALLIADKLELTAWVVGNKVAGPADQERLIAAFAGREVMFVPWDGAVEEADRAGEAPLDFAPVSPGVKAMIQVADAVVA